VALATATHPYTRIIEGLPVKSPIWTATLIGAIGDIARFSNVSQFKPYLGWSPQRTRSGSSVNESELAETGSADALSCMAFATADRESRQLAVCQLLPRGTSPPTAPTSGPAHRQTRRRRAPEFCHQARGGQLRLDGRDFIRQRRSPPLQRCASSA
jgi:Transposase IS116/IS110/IS902 family